MTPPKNVLLFRATRARRAAALRAAAAARRPKAPKLKNNKNSATGRFARVAANLVSTGTLSRIEKINSSGTASVVKPALPPKPTVKKTTGKVKTTLPPAVHLQLIKEAYITTTTTTTTTSTQITAEGVRKPSAGVYVLQLEQGFVYVGKSQNIQRRLAQHVRGEGARSVRISTPLIQPISKHAPRRLRPTTITAVSSKKGSHQLVPSVPSAQVAD